MNQAGAQLPLRDIHLPGAPSWWPPAPGWWILMVLVIVLAFGLAWWRRRRRALERSALNAARRELTRLREIDEPAATVRDVSELLRRLAISLFPRRDTAGLTGEDWLRFLDGPMEGKPFSDGPGRILVNAPYRRSVTEEEVRPLLDLCAHWMDSVQTRARAGRSR